uniref:Uncharacterized protein n=1 Tax=Fibrocapsa japonica TaxID=94617 RepID=A0A7S2Y3A8_9STRA|mmetsp:Transcript_4722/g.7044  ORF Transcript_4722/g.7044 Transcript_4722/m.7044 type:complete len:244 (+) Transcript_4722:78-809(+)
MREDTALLEDDYDPDSIVLEDEGPSKILYILVILPLVVFAAVSGANISSILKSGKEAVAADSNLIDAHGEPCSGFDGSDKFECCTDASFPVLGGLDVVEFRKTAGATVATGLQQYSVEVDADDGGYNFWFINEENKNYFESNPAFFEPAFGAFDSSTYCALVDDEEADLQIDHMVDVSSWAVHDGKLYFFSGPEGLTKFHEDQDSYTSCRSLSGLGFSFGEPEPHTMKIFNTQCYIKPDLSLD